MRQPNTKINRADSTTHHPGGAKQYGNVLPPGKVVPLEVARTFRHYAVTADPSPRAIFTNITPCDYIRAATNGHRNHLMKYAALLFSLALAIRLGFVLLVGQGALSLDEIEYHMLAANVAEGNGYRWFFGLPSTFRPPGYPLLLSVLYFFIGPNYFVARIVQSCIAATIPVFTYLLGREVFSERVGRLGGLFTALYPPLVVHCAALLTENVFIPLLCLAFWLLIRSRSEERPRIHIVASVVVALAIFVRPSFTFFLPVIWLWLGLTAQTRQLALKKIAILAGIWILVVAPWCIRNYQHTGKFTYLDTRAGYNLYVGYREGADGSFDMTAAQELIDAFMELNIPKIQAGLDTPLTKSQVYQRLNAELFSYRHPDFPNHIPEGTYDLSGVESDVLIHEWGLERTKEFIRDHPWRALGLMPLKFMSFWNLEHRLFVFAYSHNFLGAIPAPLLALLFFLLVAPFAILTLFGVFGASGQRCRVDIVLLLLGLIAYYSAMHSVVFGEARLHYPLVPIIALFAAAGLVHRKQWAAGLASEKPSLRRWTQVRLGVALAVSALFIGIWSFGLYNSWTRIATVFGPGGNTSNLPF